MSDASTSSNLVSRLRQRLITVPKPDTKPFDMPAAGYFQMGSVGGTHKPGDSAGVLSVFSTCVSVGNKLQEHIYAVDPLCEEAAQALERTPSETTDEVAALRAVIARLEDWQNQESAQWCEMRYQDDVLVNRVVAECEFARRGIGVTYAEGDDPLQKLKRVMPSMEQLETSQRALREYQSRRVESLPVEPKAPRDAEDALLEIERHSRRIEILCDYFKFDPAEFLAEGRAENGEVTL